MPITSPPHDANTIDPFWLEGAPGSRPLDLLWFDLHGEPSDPVWRGDDRRVALTAGQVHGLDLGGAVVFAATCHLGEGEPMLQALLDAGAGAVIGGDGANYAGRRGVFGAGLLGKWIRWALAVGLQPGPALRVAKARLAVSAVVGRQRGPARDALGFVAHV